MFNLSDEAWGDYPETAAPALPSRAEITAGLTPAQPPQRRMNTGCLAFSGRLPMPCLRMTLIPRAVYAPSGSSWSRWAAARRIELGRAGLARPAAQSGRNVQQGHQTLPAGGSLRAGRVPPRARPGLLLQPYLTARAVFGAEFFDRECQRLPDVMRRVGYGEACRCWIAGQDAVEGIIAKGHQLIADASAFHDLSTSLGHED